MDNEDFETGNSIDIGDGPKLPGLSGCYASVLETLFVGSAS